MNQEGEILSVEAVSETVNLKAFKFKVKRARPFIYKWFLPFLV